MYQKSIVTSNSLVFAYGGPAGRILGHEGRHCAYDLNWAAIGTPWSTERRALHAIGQHALLSNYGTYAEVLLDELSRGLVALDQEPANLNRLERCTESDIRHISTELLALGWSTNEVAKLVSWWRDLRELAR